MIINEKDSFPMAFSPTQSPVYGGDTLVIQLSPDQLKQNEFKYFLVFEGTRRRHVVSAHPGAQEDNSLYAFIPGHDIAEEVNVILYQVAEDNSSYVPIARCYFKYEYDSTFYLTKFLTSSVYNDHALDNLELIKSDRFDLSNEILSTLDTRLDRSLRNANFGTTWHLLGGDSINDAHCEERETLLHFCARLGLQQVAQYLLEQPGSEDALRLPNRHGELPYAIAKQNGFHDLAEMLSGYNIHGIVTAEQEAVEMDNAVLRNYGNGTASLTSFLDSPTIERSVENEINFLKETEEMIKVQRGFMPHRHYDSDWPNAANLQQQTGASRSLPTLPLGQEMEESLDRLLRQQIMHRNNIHSFLRTTSLPASEGQREDGRYSRGTNSFDETDGGGSVDGDAGVGGRGMQQQPPNRPTSLRPGIPVSEDILANSSLPYRMFEPSLTGVKELTEGLFQIRDSQLYQRLASKDLRKRHFARFSSSCPSLAGPVHCIALSPIDEGDHHKSMHDLVEELGTQSPSQAYVDPGQQDYISGSKSGSLQQDVSFEQGIRICINGVTVDSSEDFPTSSKSPSRSSDTGGPSSRKYSRLKDGNDQDDAQGCHGSWCQEPTILRSGLPFDRRDQQTRVRMLAMTGKSLSLTSLEGDEESEDEDFMGPTNEEPHPKALPMPGSTHGTVFDRDADTQSGSPVDSTGSSPGREMPVPGVMLSQSKIGSDLTLSNNHNNAKSLTDLSITTEPNQTQRNDGSHHGSPGGPGLKAHHSYDDGGALAVPHSSMTKSLSTPSIPQATEAAGERAQGVRERREGKHHEENQFYFQNYAEDDDAQFRRQKEIEEEEEDENVSSGDKQKEITWSDFLNEEQSPNDSDEKSSKGGRKEDKKRKPSVFSRFQSSYRTKKNKEKESKHKDRHHFVAISFSNATACHVCHKPMANKAALRCENCLVNVHEHNCKDQVTHCDKNRNKALQRDGSAHGPHGPPQTTQGTLLERQTAPVAGTSLRPSQSFKDKRSVSAPVKTQPGQLSAPAPLSHRHSLPTSSLFGSPPNNVSGFVPWQAGSMGRFSVLDKAISEESETDTTSITTMDMGQSNMTDTISESMESLDGGYGAISQESGWFDDEPDLQLSIEEPEAWSITVDRKTLKKLGTKDIKRQDTIWELINTEKQYVKRLKIMQKIFTQTMLRDLNCTEDQVERLFPRLDELTELHANFLRQLLSRQAKNEDRSVDDIGDVLVGQFQDSTADKMKSVYGVFCSKHTEAMQLYKELIKVDRKFQNFAKKCTNLSVCEKRDISDFILGVTVRLSKYPILIEAILKSTKDKKDRENLSQALLLSKDVVQHVDEKVAAYEKLVDIQSKMDSRAVMFKGKKFKRQDLNGDSRELVHAGKIGWKSARGRVYDVLAVVLTDMIVFLQKNEQKYTFLMQDNKSCVIPLFRLLVREKRDARDSLGIYMISQNRTTPEMYELVCQSKTEREDWIRILQEAIRTCPPDVENDIAQVTNPAASVSSDEDRRRKDEHTNQIKMIIEQLHQKDEAIRECCDEKSKLMVELFELSTPRSEAGSRPNSQEVINVTESVEVVQAAMQEASRLTTIIQGSGTQLSRSVSSVGEHHSNNFVATPIPKRAETFSGFDSSHESPKMSAMKERYVNSGQEEDEGRSASMLSLDQQEGDSSFSDAPDTVPATKESSTVESKSVATVQQPSYQPSPLQHPGNAHLWEEQVSSDRSSDRGSLGELSAASVSSLVPSPSNQEQMTSIFHLVQYLNTLMNLTSKQCTKVESLRAELAEAKEEIAKLSADVQAGRRSVYRHDQLEELRNLQENISRERQEWERTKRQDRSWLEREREKLENERREIEREKVELRTRKEELKRQKEVLQCQLDMMRDRGLSVSSSFSDQAPEDGDLDKKDNGAGRPINHRRSASADFYNSVTLSDVENLQNFPPGSAEAAKEYPRQPRLSVGSLQSQNANAALPPKQPALPMHLLSARNEQRVGGANVQRLPLKLAGSNSSSLSNPSQQHPSAISPSPAFCAGVQQPFPGRAGSTGVSRVQSMSATSRPALAHQQENSRSAPSGLSKVMKLADPKGKSSSSSSASSGSKTTSAPSSSKTAAPHAGGAPGGPVPKTETSKEGPDGIIYF